MIPALRSIDCLFTRFDELSKCHKNFLSDFDKTISVAKNPLRDVVRSEEEQQKATKDVLFAITKNDKQIGSIKTLEDFHRNIIKNRYLHRPPHYSPSDKLLFNRTISRTSSMATESTTFSNTSETIVNPPLVSQLSVVPISNKNINAVKVHVSTNIKPKCLQQNSSPTKRSVRSTIKVFSMETVNRLSKPKIYHQIPSEKPRKKHIQQRPKRRENVKKDKLKCSTSSFISLPSIKRTQTTKMEPVSKWSKIKNNSQTQKRQKAPTADFSSGPFAVIATVPILRLTFPRHLEQQLPPLDVLPKIIPKNKRGAAHSLT
ncbi:unnamed protein product [Rotaria magnacalcarata]|uniref:Uncharacterized protein n=1 Tax=Rotaria magnacalcarata TaxID=392030 RepID=A0A814WX39_9BILA|nr:unnamed protein product [Rotaria magnacalcarata]CAF1585758.1 unnamed protein product [Rotaria magnacalcarata]CAF2058682.1 unnamed protein product [Rotaria magnacalcarata]CAF4078391.1 unnamed protein product [Rotaria magnacalcarata]CAF4128403.1 unnamed protein product [Rotaria magnacalcarata]